jgi:16S rRNA (guanine527-N7)-methyltransferase
VNRAGGVRPDPVGRGDDHGTGSGARRGPAMGPGNATRDRAPLPTNPAELLPLGAAFDEVLDAGLDRLGLAGAPRLRSALDAHARLLVAWTVAINLTAIREPAAVAREHLLDSLSAVTLLREREIDAFVDLGSGGGFPGLPLACALPARRALLLDSIAKKVRFLETAVSALEAEALLPAGAVDAAALRAETLAADPRHRERWPAVTARAVTELGELVELAFPLLRPGGLLVAWKRVGLEEELAAARALLPALGGGRVELRAVRLDGLEDHRLVVVTKLGPTPDRYPRPPAERRR